MPESVCVKYVNAGITHYIGRRIRAEYECKKWFTNPFERELLGNWSATFEFGFRLTPPNGHISHLNVNDASLLINSKQPENLLSPGDVGMTTKLSGDFP